MAEDLGERTEEATPKRWQESREAGNVAQSQDLASAILLLVATLTLWGGLTPLLGAFRRLLETLLDHDAAALSHPTEAADALARSLEMALLAAGPIMLIAWLAAALSHVGQIGWLFAPKALAPKFGKLNPMQGFKRIFGVRGAVKACMDFAKVGLVLAVALITILGRVEDLVGLPERTAVQACVAVGGMLLDLALRVAVVLLVLGLLDLIHQKWRHRIDLRMTKQQVRDELKQTEGDPDVKRRRLRMQQQIAMQRISTAVPKADVIVTNPEHISIAIQYDSAAMRAPKVVAKGADYLALRIRQLAMQHGIPIIERKPLARELYRQVAVNQEIPPAFYQAVAEILAYVYRLSGRRAG
jgi:flagellar biosynthetic protein FlhB